MRVDDMLHNCVARRFILHFWRLSLALGVLAAWCLVPPAIAQSRGGPSSAMVEPAQAVQRFREAYPGEWVVRFPHRTLAPALIYGVAIPREQLGAGDDVDVAARFLSEWQDILGYSVETLVLREAFHIPLGRVGSSNKSAVVFDQEVHGLEVVGGGVTLVFGSRGELLALDNHGLPGAGRVLLEPALSHGRALSLARSFFGGRSFVLSDDLSIVPDERSGKRLALLAYRIEIADEPGGGDRAGIPHREMFWIDAHDGSLVRRFETVYRIDLIGTTHGFATPGLLPDVSSNPPVEMPLPGMRMTSTVGDAVTGPDGDWVIPYSGNSPQDVTAAALGPWVDVDNAAGANISLTRKVRPGVPDLFVLNTSPVELDTAQLNAFFHVQVFRDFIKALDPSDAMLDFPVLANVNISNSCNAFWDGRSINFFRSSSGCPNTAYSTVISHEEGHWANALYNGHGITGSFHEGAADSWAMYIHDDSEVGRLFFGGKGLRSGWNSRPFCGDDVGDSCWGEPHAGGEPLMGALWKVRHNLDAALGDAPGDLLADNLYYWWMRVFDDEEILSMIEDHWLVLDDDDGYLPNGTPHWEAIDRGFRANRFPGVDLRPIVIEHEPLWEAQRAGVSIDVDAVIRIEGAGMARASVWYSTDGGANYTPLAMSPTGDPDTYRASIPPQPTPAVVSYYIEASDTNGRSRIVPVHAPDRNRHLFYVGRVHEVLAFDYERKDQWNHGAYYGIDSWERGEPGYAEPTDALYAHSGRRVWGTDLGAGGSDGRYDPSSHLYLRSPPFDFTGRTALRLQYRRWLSLQGGGADRIPLSVAGTVIDDPLFSGDVFDEDWTLQEFDIAALADNSTGVEIEFGLVSDGAVELGGISLDDLRIVSIEPGVPVPDDCTMPVLYGLGTGGSGGIKPQILASDYPVLGDDQFQIIGEQALGGALGYLLLGSASTLQSWLGGFLLIDPAAMVMVVPAQFDGAPGVPGVGRAAVRFRLPADPTLDGSAAYGQWIVLDPGARGGVAMSRGLEIIFCY